MGVIKNWNTVYPVAIDDLVTNFPVLVDATDDVIASHSNELAKAVVALETEQQAIVTTVSGLGNVQALYNSVSQTTTLRSINFTGSGVAVTTVGNDVTVTVSTSTTDRYSDTIIVGNSAAGDTTATCHYLETGTGAALVSALTAAGALSPPGNVFIRRGTYTTTAQTTMINVPAGVHVSGAGIGATIITGRSTGDIGIFSVKAGASLSNLSVTAPTPSAGATCPNYLVELLNNSTLKNVVINVAAGTNSPLTFVTGYYAAGIPDGITIEDVRINVTGSSIPAGYIDAIDIGDSSGATYINPTKPVSIKNVVVDVSGANKDCIAAAMTLLSLGVVVDSCKSVGCGLLNFSPSGSLGTATVAGPTVHNCIADLTGRPAGTHYGVSLQPVCYNGTVIGTVIDGITVLGSASSAADSRAVLFNVVPTTSPVTFKGNTISNVSSYFSTAGAGGIDIEAQAGATISSTKVSNCAVTGDSLISCAATGYVSDTDIINNAGRNFSITGTSANTTGLRLASPRFTGTITVNEATTRTVGYYTVATTANLPNVSGSPTQTSYLSVGDEAYVTGSASTYVCTNATVGSAVWSGGVTTGAPIYATNIFFSPSNPSPAQGVITTWTALQAALTAAGQWTPKRVHVDGQYVGYVITVPAGITHVWDMTEFLGDGSELDFAQSCSISSFWGVGFTRLFLSCLATTGSSPFTAYVSGYGGLPVYLREGSYIAPTGSGYLPLFSAGAGVDNLGFTMADGTFLLESGTSTCIRLNGGTATFECQGDATVGSGAIASSNAGSFVTLYVAVGYGKRIGSSAFTDIVHTVWTLGTISFNKRTSASMLTVTPTGNITSTEAQSALAELDTKKAAISGGQLGGTGAAPDVRGIRETAGPTLLTMGAIADGQMLVRSGTTIVGTTTPTSITGTMVKPNLRLAGLSPVTVSGTYRDIAWSPSLGLFCAVGSAGVIVTSPDGITWTPRTSGTVYNLVGVCWAAGLGLFVACGNDSGGFNAEIRTSPDGITWTQRYTAANPPALNGVATNAAGTTVIAFGTAGLMLSSTNGTSWTSRTSGFGTDIIYQVAWNGTLFVAVGGAGKISTSPDGITWTARTSGTASVLYGVTANPATGRCVAVGVTGTVLTSADGITWTTPNTVYNIGSVNVITVGFGDGVFIIGPIASGSSIWVSPDGINWSLRNAQTGVNVGTATPTRGAVYGGGRYCWPGASYIITSDVIT